MFITFIRSHFHTFTLQIQRDLEKGFHAAGDEPAVTV